MTKTRGGGGGVGAKRKRAVDSNRYGSILQSQSRPASWPSTNNNRSPSPRRPRTTASLMSSTPSSSPVHQPERLSNLSHNILDLNTALNPLIREIDDDDMEMHVSPQVNLTTAQNQMVTPYHTAHRHVHSVSNGALLGELEIRQLPPEDDCFVSPQVPLTIRNSQMDDNGRLIGASNTHSPGSNLGQRLFGSQQSQKSTFAEFKFSQPSESQQMISQFGSMKAPSDGIPSQQSLSVSQDDYYATPQNAPIIHKSFKDVSRELENQRVVTKAGLDLNQRQVFLTSDISNPFIRYFDISEIVPSKSSAANIQIKDHSGRLMSDFALIKRLGEGDFGSVGLYRNKLDCCTYAIKELLNVIASNKALKKVLRECWALSCLGSSQAHSAVPDHVERGFLHVVRYYSSWIEDRKLFIQLEYCAGGNLEKLLHDDPESFSIDRICKILYDISSALAVCHSLHICHLDVKPANILESRPGTGKFKLCDFGLAFPCGNPSSLFDFPEDGDARYLSPELLQKQGRLSQDALFKSDIFSLGAAILELASKRPFDESNVVRNPSHVHELLANSSLTRDLQTLLTSMLDHDPTKRPSAEDVMFISHKMQVSEGH